MSAGIVCTLSPKVNEVIFSSMPSNVLELDEVQEIAFQVMLVSPVQSENAEPPMLVTPSGMVILVSPVQYENAEPLMLVTLLGMVMLVSPVQPENA